MRRRIVIFPAQIGKISIFNRPGGFAKGCKSGAGGHNDTAFRLNFRFLSSLAIFIIIW